MIKENSALRSIITGIFYNDTHVVVLGVMIIAINGMKYLATATLSIMGFITALILLYYHYVNSLTSFDVEKYIVSVTTGVLFGVIIRTQYEEYIGSPISTIETMFFIVGTSLYFGFLWVRYFGESNLYQSLFINESDKISDDLIMLHPSSSLTTRFAFWNQVDAMNIFDVIIPSYTSLPKYLCVSTFDIQSMIQIESDKDLLKFINMNKREFHKSNKVFCFNCMSPSVQYRFKDVDIEGVKSVGSSLHNESVCEDCQEKCIKFALEQELIEPVEVYVKQV